VVILHLQYLSKLQVGDYMDIKGPQGSLEYLGFGKFVIQREAAEQKLEVTSIGMLAGGTGITPMLQVNSVLSGRS